MEKLKMHSPDLVAGNIEKIAALFPNCITETKDATGKLTRAVDFDLLKQELSGSVVEGPQERYRLDWPGKREAMLAANTLLNRTLRPAISESIDFETTKNLFITGDNLEALKLLQESYANKVKLIYIDPPYNTGSDFLYADNFSASPNAHKIKSNEESIEGIRLVRNLDTNGRFHSDWLSSLYPRIKLAFNLLRPDGVILISIDDNEYANLYKVCEEIFGGDNYCGTFIWEKKKKPSFLNANMGTVTEYILAFSRDRANSPAFTAGSVEDGKKYPFNNAGNGVKDLTFPPGSVQFKMTDGTIAAQDMSEGNIVTHLLNDVVIKEGTNVNSFSLRGEWRYSQDKLNEFVKNNAEIIISKVPFRPNYINRSGDQKKTANLLSHRTNGTPTNEDATEEIREIFGADVMSHPKPTGLIEYLIRATTNNDDLILDFYAGSGTTAHAVMKINTHDSSLRRFIMVQLDEKCEEGTLAHKQGFPTIAKLAQERIRRAGMHLRQANATTSANLDFGFRSLKVDSTCFEDVYYKPDETTQGELVALADNIKSDRSPDDILFQVMLDWGLDLALPIKRETIEGRNIHVVDENALIACIERDVDESVIKAIAQKKPLRALFRDNGFTSDCSRINAEQIFKSLSPETEIKCI